MELQKELNEIFDDELLQGEIIKSAKIINSENKACDVTLMYWNYFSQYILYINDNEVINSKNYDYAMDVYNSIVNK